jgi:arylsulfatase A-like enzyme
MRRLGWDAAEQERFRASVELFYQADVAHLDSLFGGVVDAIAEAGLEDDALVTFTADHGETLFRADLPFKWTHGFQLAPEELEIPLLIGGPAVAAGRYPGLTRSIDVLPTLAGLAGVSLPDHFARPDPEPFGVGRDLRAAIRGDEPAPDLTAFVQTGLILEKFWPRFESFGTLAAYFPHSRPESIWAGSRRGDLFLQLRRKPGEAFAFALFDLKTDPQMQRDLFYEGDPPHAAARALVDYRGRSIAAVHGRFDRPIPSDAEQRLRSLGYIE